MKVRRLKKLKQEQQGWPTTVKHKSSYGWPDFYNDIWPIRKFVHPAMWITTWSRAAWRGSGSSPRMVRAKL